MEVSNDTVEKVVGILGMKRFGALIGAENAFFLATEAVLERRGLVGFVRMRWMM